MKKGFTLIELLAVIVVLAVIAIIAIPIITNVIDKAKVGALKDSAYGILDAGDVYLASNLKEGIDSNIKFTCSNNKCINDTKEINYKGKIKEGTLILTTDSKALVCVDDGKNYVLKLEDEKKVKSGKGTCGEYEEENGTFNIIEATEARIEELENANNKLKAQINKFASKVSYDYQYTGNYQEFVAPISATYKIELWGAQGGNNSATYVGGSGGYTKGEIYLNEDQKLYLYVGGTTTSVSGGWNGGGNGYTTSSRYGYGGGGATDVRLVSTSSSTEWNNFDSLKSRIMVAAGGSGSSNCPDCSPGWYNYNGSAGGLTGYSGEHGAGAYSTGATQIAGGIPWQTANLGENGIFGKGGNGYTNWGTSGGGGGYYGGAGSSHAGAASSGGSSYVSGHNGCDSIVESSTSSSITHTGSSIHYSNFKFTNTKIIDGRGYNWTNVKGDLTNMPKHDGTTDTMVGNTGNGYAKITLVNVD